MAEIKVDKLPDEKLKSLGADNWSPSFEYFLQTIEFFLWSIQI